MGYTCTINEIVNNLKVDENPEYPYFCLFPSSIDVQIPATVTLDEEGNLLAGKYRLSDRQQLAEGTSITVRKVRPILEAGALIWGTVLQYDLEKPAQKVEVREEKNTKGPNIAEFNFVQEAGYKDIYALLGKAMKYYDSDPEQSCKNFRSLLKLTVDEAEKITNCSSRGGLKKKIDDLCSYLSERGLINESIIRELRVVKRLGDQYVHSEDYPELNPKKDRYTFYCAFQEVFKWLVALPNNYAAFIRERENETLRLKAERKRLKEEAKERKRREKELIALETKKMEQRAEEGIRKAAERRKHEAELALELARKKQEDEEREEAEKKALEELKKQEEAERKRLERNAKARERRRLARAAKEIELKMAAKKAEEEAKAAEKEAKKQLRKIRWQKRVETAKKFLPWVGYGAATIVGGIAAGINVSSIGDAIKKMKKN